MNKNYESMTDEEKIAYNKELIQKYPFLLPRNRWTGEVSDDYDYSYTELDDMDTGWRIAFGEQMCEEIEQELEKYNFQNEYRITQLKEKYGCYDEETEVLTANGWKHFKDVDYNDSFATLDGQNLIYEKPTDIISYHYSGKMYRLENRGISLCVTPNHNLYVSKGSYYTFDHKKRTYDFEFATPEKYFWKKKRFLKGGAIWHGKIPTTYHIDGFEYTNWMSINNCFRRYKLRDFDVDIKPFLRFLGFYVAEGSTYIDKNNGRECQISVAYNSYDEEDLVYNLIKGIGFEPKQAAKCVKTFYNETLAHWLNENCGHLAPNKKVPSFIKELSPDLIEEFLIYLYIGDGHKAPTSNILTTTSKQLKDDVEELLLKCGYCFRDCMRTAQERNGGKKSSSTINARKIMSKHDIYEINWLKTNEIETDIHKAKDAKSYIEDWIYYDGEVYCVTIPSHLLYIRRNGKGLWCGNSLRWYDFGAPGDIQKIIDKYEVISMRTCIGCGSPATRISKGWISPWCDKCAEERKLNCWPIDEYYDDFGDEDGEE